MNLNSRKDKLIYLQKFVDLETNEIKNDDSGNELYYKILNKNRIDRHIDRCSRCGTSFNIKSYTRSVKGFGNINADIFLIGESPCSHSMIAQLPFAWESGRILDIILELSNLNRYNIFISNSIHCHLESKRPPTNIEIKRCNRILYEEIQIVNPTLVVALGNSAKTAIKYIHKRTKKIKHKTIYVKHPASFLYNSAGLQDYILKVSLELDKAKK